MNPSGKFSKEEQERFNVAVDIMTDEESPMIYARKKKLSERHDTIEVFFANATTYIEATEFLDELQGYLDQKFGIDRGDEGVN